MHGFINVASFDGIIVYVLQFLKHHLIALDLLGHAPFLPNLIIALGLVPPLQRPKLAEKYLGTLGFQQVDDLSGRVHFETFYGVRQLWCGGNQVQVILQDHVGVQPKAFFLFEKNPGVEDYLHGLGPRENSLSTHDRTSEEIRISVVEDAVTTAGHVAVSLIARDGLAIETRNGVSPEARSQTEFGNEKGKSLRMYNNLLRFRIVQYPRHMGDKFQLHNRKICKGFW